MGTILHRKLPRNRSIIHDRKGCFVCLHAQPNTGFIQYIHPSCFFGHPVLGWHWYITYDIWVFSNQINGWKLCNMDDNQQKSSIILPTLHMGSQPITNCNKSWIHQVCVCVMGGQWQKGLFCLSACSTKHGFHSLHSSLLFFVIQFLTNDTDT